MKEGLRILTTAESTEQQMINALDEIIEWCENLDFAAGLYMYQSSNFEKYFSIDSSTSKFEFFIRDEKLFISWVLHVFVSFLLS